MAEIKMIEALLTEPQKKLRDEVREFVKWGPKQLGAVPRHSIHSRGQLDGYFIQYYWYYEPHFIINVGQLSSQIRKRCPVTEGRVFPISRQPKPRISFLSSVTFIHDLPPNSSPLSMVKTVDDFTPCDLSHEMTQRYQHSPLVHDFSLE